MANALEYGLVAAVGVLFFGATGLSTCKNTAKDISPQGGKNTLCNNACQHQKVGSMVKDFNDRNMPDQYNQQVATFIPDPLVAGQSVRVTQIKNEVSFEYKGVIDEKGQAIPLECIEVSSISDGAFLVKDGAYTPVNGDWKTYSSPYYNGPSDKMPDCDDKTHRHYDTTVRRYIAKVEASPQVKQMCAELN